MSGFRWRKRNGEVEPGNLVGLEMQAMRDRPDPFVPRDDRVVAGRQAGNRVAPLRIRHGEVRVIEHQSHSAHVRMDMTEHLHDAAAVERHGAR